jgi:hypothetical protein
MGGGFSRPFAQKLEDTIFDFGRDFFRADRRRDSNGFLVGIQEMNTIRADLEMLLKIAFEIAAQVAVQIVVQ